MSSPTPSSEGNKNSSQPPKTMLVFVYGTLKKGYGNHRLLEKSEYVGEATTQNNYRIYDSGRYPCMVETASGIGIQGQIYRVDEATAALLDRLEGVPFLYKRAKISIRGRDENSEDVIGYIYQRSVEEMIDCGNSWPSGRSA